MSQVEQIKIFLASPSDVQKEREYVYDVIHDIDKTNSHGVRLNVTSSKDSYPDYGKDGQQHIVEQLLSNIQEYDLLVVIMWNRIGTPTPRAESGTVEEFQNFEENIKDNKSKIWCYFRTAPELLDTEEALEQKIEVVRFKQKIQKKGLYKEYSTPENFRDEFCRNITQWLNKRQKENIPSLSPIPKPVDTPTPKLDDKTTAININDTIKGIKNGDLNVLKEFPIFKKPSKNDNSNHQSNEKNLINDIKKGLLRIYNTDKSIAEDLIKLLMSTNKKELKNNYVAGNIINLLLKLGLNNDLDFSYFDLSSISIWDADFDLLKATLTGVDFSKSDLKNTSFSEPLGCIHSIAFNADGSYFATGDAHGLIRVYENNSESLKTPILKRILKNERGNQIWSVAFNPNPPQDCQILAWGAEDGSVKVIKIDSSSSSNNDSQGVNTIYKADEGRRISSVAFSPDGNTFAIGGDGDKAIKLVGINNNNLSSINLSATDVYCMTFVDNERIAYGGQDGTVRLQHLTQDETTVDDIQEHRTVVRCIAYEKTKKIIASGDENGQVKMYYMSEKNSLDLDLGRQISQVRTLAFSEDGNILAIGYIDNKNSASSEHKIWLWIFQDGRWSEKGELDNLNHDGHEHLIRSVAFCPNPNQRNLLISGGDGRTVKLWDISTSESELKCNHTLRGYANRIWSVAISRDGKTFACGGEDSKIRLWNYCDRTHIPTHTLSRHTDWVWSVAFCPKGEILASGSENNRIFLWQLKEGNWEYVHELEGHNKRVRCVTFHPTEQLLASAGNDNTVFLWDISQLEQPRLLKKFDSHSDRVLSIAFSPDGNYLASSSRDQTIYLYFKDTNTWKEESNWNSNNQYQHKDQIHSIAFSTSKKELVSGAFDKQLKLWEVPSGKCLKTWNGEQKILTVAFHPKEKIIATAGDRNFITLWNIEDINKIKVIKKLKGHKRTVESIVFSPDGKRLISCSQDQTIKFWDIDGHINISIHTIELGKPYQGMNISGVENLAESQISALLELGAFRNV